MKYFALHERISSNHFFCSDPPPSSPSPPKHSNDIDGCSTHPQVLSVDTDDERRPLTSSTKAGLLLWPLVSNRLNVKGMRFPVLSMIRNSLSDNHFFLLLPPTHLDSSLPTPHSSKGLWNVLRSWNPSRPPPSFSFPGSHGHRQQESIETPRQEAGGKETENEIA